MGFTTQAMPSSFTSMLYIRGAHICHSFVIFAFMNVNKQLPPSIMEMLSRSQPTDPPKGYKYNESGELVPIDWSETHGEGGEEPLLDWEGLSRGVSQVESAGGILMMNPHSSATGEFGQLYNEIKDLPFMKGVDRKAFSKDRRLQAKVFEMRVEGDLPNIPSLRGNANDLTNEYAKQLGDDWTYTLDEVAAISNYIGRQGSRNYFSSIRDGVEYKPSGVNKSVEEYLELYRQGRDSGLETPQDPNTFQDPNAFKH